jgi:hypothetical protein
MFRGVSDWRCRRQHPRMRCSARTGKLQREMERSPRSVPCSPKWVQCADCDRRRDRSESGRKCPAQSRRVLQADATVPGRNTKMPNKRRPDAEALRWVPYRGLHWPRQPSMACRLFARVISLARPNPVLPPSASHQDTRRCEDSPGSVTFRAPAGTGVRQGKSRVGRSARRCFRN